MISNKENKWWEMFVPRKTSRDEDSCPVLPVAEGCAWHKDLVNLFCPCRPDSNAYECQLIT